MARSTSATSATSTASWRNVPGKNEVTLASLRKSIPPELFRRSTAESLGHTAFDLLTVWATYAVAQALLSVGAPAWCVYPAYIVAQGFNLTALWVLGHECGHGGFTDHKWLNDAVGLFLPVKQSRIDEDNEHISFSAGCDHLFDEHIFKYICRSGL